MSSGRYVDNAGEASIIRLVEPGDTLSDTCNELCRVLRLKF